MTQLNLWSESMSESHDEINLFDELPKNYLGLEKSVFRLKGLRERTILKFDEDRNTVSRELTLDRIGLDFLNFLDEVPTSILAIFLYQNNQVNLRRIEEGLGIDVNQDEMALSIQALQKYSEILNQVAMGSEITLSDIRKQAFQRMASNFFVFLWYIGDERNQAGRFLNTLKLLNDFTNQVNHLKSDIQSYKEHLAGTNELESTVQQFLIARQKGILIKFNYPALSDIQRKTLLSLCQNPGQIEKIEKELALKDFPMFKSLKEKGLISFSEEYKSYFIPNVSLNQFITFILDTYYISVVQYAYLLKDDQWREIVEKGSSLFDDRDQPLLAAYLYNLNNKTNYKMISQRNFKDVYAGMEYIYSKIASIK